ncbi:hypothetical protein N431DRAFT_434699 [Stipitochalara longipes BDJ]|nr:hypothetical protein N431DRAFT_434699 [Stipitochalara longipes BDJ]
MLQKNLLLPILRVRSPLSATIPNPAPSEPEDRERGPRSGLTDIKDLLSVPLRARVSLCTSVSTNLCLTQPHTVSALLSPVIMSRLAQSENAMQGYKLNYLTSLVKNDNICLTPPTPQILQPRHVFPILPSLFAFPYLTISARTPPNLSH